MLLANEIYHIYNRGNNKQQIFDTSENYLFFLRKIRRHIAPCVDILCYCLMPNHFHILISTRADFNATLFTNALKTTLSSYTRAINSQRGSSGSLFQQNTKIKLVDNHGYYCFHYIHQNPLKAGLVSNLHEWEYSSYRDYSKLRNGTLCSYETTYLLLDIPNTPKLFQKESHSIVPDQYILAFT